MNEELVDSLNEILQFLYDSADCYEKNIGNTSDNNLKELFSYLSQQRSQMIDEIRDRINQLGGDPKESGTFTAKVHEIYENIKNLITNNDPLTLTKEIKRGEDMLIECYKEALKRNMPDVTKSLLLSHLDQIHEELKRVDMCAVTSDNKS